MAYRSTMPPPASWYPRQRATAGIMASATKKIAFLSASNKHARVGALGSVGESQQPRDGLARRQWRAIWRVDLIPKKLP